MAGRGVAVYGAGVAKDLWEGIKCTLMDTATSSSAAAMCGEGRRGRGDERQMGGGEEAGCTGAIM